MKAKEIAKVIFENPTDGAALKVLSEMIKEAVAMAKMRRSDESKLAVFRESFQKWRAVCAIVAGGTAGEIDGIALYPKAMQIVSKGLFASCAVGGVFLSYELDSEDKAVCEQVVQQQAAEAAQERFKMNFGMVAGRIFA
jgi:hypothetical protein